MSLLARGPAAEGLPPRQAPAPPDAELVTRARRGDSLAFELVMRRHNRRLFRIARGLVWNDAEAEDVLQQSYVRGLICGWRRQGRQGSGRCWVCSTTPGKLIVITSESKRSRTSPIFSPASTDTTSSTAERMTG